MRLSLLLLLACAPLALSGCAAPVAIAAAGGTGGYYAAQERSTADEAKDAQIRLKLNEIYFDKNPSDMFKNISIDVMEGRVMLTGTVKVANTVTEAVKIAWKVDGVKEVLNDIQVTGGIDIGDYTVDSWISTQIKTRMLLEKDVRSINYTIETVGKRVYVLGLARNQAELEKVATIASTTKYVAEVISHVILFDDPRRGQNAKPTQSVGQSQGAGSAPQIYSDSVDADHTPKAYQPRQADSTYGNNQPYADTVTSGFSGGGSGVTSTDLAPPAR